MRGVAWLILMCCACNGVFSRPVGLREAPGDAAAFERLTEEQRAILCAEGAAPVPEMPTLIRLSHSQYDGVVRDLLGVENAASQFAPDPSVEGFDNNAFSLTVTDPQARDYRQSAETLAASANLSALLPCTPSAACVTQFIDSFVPRAYRRPITDAERAAFVTLHGRAPDVFDGGDAFQNGIRLIIEATLQSPNFLYRARTGPLDEHQIREQLALMLWNGLPDDELRASPMQTAEQIGAQAERMLAHPRARASIDSFHSRIFALDKLQSLQKDTTRFPMFTDTLAGAMREEALRFSSHVVLDAGGSVETLYSAPYTFVNAELAALYGLQGSFGSDFVQADFGRAGILTQSAFLATYAHARDTSPILRGVAIYRDIMCNPLQPPPANVVRTLPAASEGVKTQRQRVEAATGDAGCTGCHTLINEPGFALEGYDALGRAQTADNGEPIDASGTMSIDGESRAFGSGVELARAMAASRQARACYTRKLARYLLQRREQGEDLCTIDRVAAQSNVSIKQTIVELVRSKSAVLQ